MKHLSRPVHPSAGIEASFRRRLDRLIIDMHGSVLYWLRAEYRRQEPAIVADEDPALALQRRMRRLGEQWLRNFDRMAERLARYFATSVERRVTSSLERALADGGFAVEFRPSAEERSVLEASVQASVQLIRSIPRQYLEQVEGIVMRGVQNGRDLAQVTTDLEQRLGVTRRRARLIARDQNNKATAALSRARMIQAGVKEAVWVHSGGGKEPRPSHVRAGLHRTRFKVDEGWYDPAEHRHIQPGELINCRCVARAVIPGFS